MRVSAAEFERSRKIFNERKTKRQAKAKEIWAKKPKSWNAAAIKKELDAICSIVVRRRDSKKTGGLCVFNCGRPIQCAFHFIRKSRSLKLRYDLRNIVGSCMACNGYMEHCEGPFWTWYAKTHGIEKMESLQIESHGAANWPRSKFAEIRAFLKKELES